MLITLEVTLLFTVSSAALAVAPGPDNIFVLAQSAIHGRKAGILVTLGLCTGLLFHITAVALGVAAVIMASSIAFTILKAAGAGYLLYLAWQAFRAGDARIDTSKGDVLSAKALYFRGILMNISNPKIAIFFLAFLPQFADPARGSVAAQIVILGLLFMGTTLVIFGAIAWASGRIGVWLRKSYRAQSIMNRTAGMIFLLLACRLALSKP